MDHGDFDANINMTTDEISARDNKLNDDYTIKIDVPPSACVINHADNTGLSDDNENQPTNQRQNPSTARRTFPTILKMIVGCVKRDIFDLDSDNDDSSTNDVPHTPTMTEILEKAKRHHNIELDSKQLKAYEMICATFMIKLIRDQISGTSSEQGHTEQAARINRIIEGLKSLGGKDQLIMFLTGPAGAGKTTSIKLAQTFCEKFSLACNIPFDQYSFYFTAYTGAAASEYGGITTLSALQIKPMSNNITEATESTRSTLNKVKILIMDEISFMSVKDLQLISKRLQELFECATPFGGMSIIFSGDFRQLEPGQTDSQLLYTTHSNMYFENLLNAALILENKHRFKEDPVYGQMMSDMWFGDLSIEQKKEINKRVVMDKRTIPDVLDDDCHYACPTNRHRNVISANNFRRHILATHR